MMSRSDRRRRWMRACVACVCLGLLAIANLAGAAQVRAWLDRSTMQVGETVTLNIEVSDDTSAAQPDFSSLKNDFDLLGSQSSTSMSIVNGQASSKLIWAVGLQPRHAGTLSIPAFSVAGAQTQPLSVTVQATSSAPAQAGDDVFLEVTVEPKNPYVQQQLRLTLKLYYALNLTDGVIEEPHGDGLVARKLGQDAAYTADVQNRRYHVLERHYALSAEKSGAVTLAPVTFRGHAVNPNDINSFFNRGRAITTQAPAVALDVRARPAASGKDVWLPAQSLTLTAEGVDAATAARVGEPLTLTLRIRAQGLGFEQLPEIKLPPIDGADVYPDKETTQNRDDGSWVNGERARKFAIVPNRAGTLRLPPMSLAWWDAAADKAQEAALPALSLNVAPAAASAAAPADAQTPIAASTSPAAATTPVTTTATVRPVAGADAGVRLWRALAVAAIVLWLATIAAFLLWRRRGGAPAPAAGAAPSSNDAGALAARKAFNGACARNDAAAAARALVAWAGAQGVSARSLGDLARQFDDPAQRDAVRELERRVYGTLAADAFGERIAGVFKKGLVLAANDADAGHASPLAAHYPRNG